MRRHLAKAVAALGLFACVHSALAQPNSDSGSFVGRVPATPGCPAVEMHIIRNNTILTGVVFYSDGSGVSKVEGTMNGENFSWKDTSIDGNGPTAGVTGTLTPLGHLKLTRNRTSCSWETTLSLIPQYGNDNGGG